MLAGEKQTEWGRIQLKSMLSLEPLMSNYGYPNLFATGETAGGEIQCLRPRQAGVRQAGLGHGHGDYISLRIALRTVTTDVTAL